MPHSVDTSSTRTGKRVWLENVFPMRPGDFFGWDRLDVGGVVGFYTDGFVLFSLFVFLKKHLKKKRNVFFTNVSQS